MITLSSQLSVAQPSSSAEREWEQDLKILAISRFSLLKSFGNVVCNCAHTCTDRATKWQVGKAAQMSRNYARPSFLRWVLDLQPWWLFHWWQYFSSVQFQTDCADPGVHIARLPPVMRGHGPIAFWRHQRRGCVATILCGAPLFTYFYTIVYCTC